MKARRYILICMLAICSSIYAKRYQMDIELMDGRTVSYAMEQVQDVIYDNGMTVIYLRGEQTVTMVIYKNEDIKEIKWSESK
ncbi:MAG: hypothetical protein J6W52_13180 [Bacteroidaceae bacterium]|nr:hypothetical protein [Bacteroidaceae bacterium]